MIDHSPTRTLTATEFLSLPESSTPMQLIDGELHVSPAPLLDHQMIISRLHLLLAGVAAIGPDQLFLSPTDVHCDDDNVFQPDIAWVSSQNDNCVRVEGKHLRGAPDLVVEVLSPGTIKQDRGKKYQVYEQYGVQEYWIVDAVERYIEVFTLRPGDNKFVQLGLFNEKATFKSPVLDDATVEVSKLFPPSQNT
jgi:Uma2 family endonuclease